MVTAQEHGHVLESKLRTVASELLKEKKVDLIIGYSKGTIPQRSSPYIARNPADTSNFIWNNLGYTNLAKYLLAKRKKKVDNKEVDLKIGVVAKGCVGRAINQLIVEKQVTRENVVIIGIPCNGMIDLNRIYEAVGTKEILDIALVGDDIVVKGRGFEKKLPFNENINTLCKACKIKTPPITDVLIGESNNLPIDEKFQDVIAFEKMPANEKRDHVQQLLHDCIKCGSCRQACPFCYCKLCFVDQNKPVWFNKTFDMNDILVFHLIRSIHLAGRCVSCGACYGACPIGINLNELTRKLEKLSKARFDYVPGMDLKTPPPMMAFKLDDDQGFILEE
nr:4Fe-4S dicluster domain-containing protein [Candidatus Sigynarchaeum springense]MDO8116218.1 4Fe-4S dicluster domain-containing protein [Candidatus Sigynarchaeota archaeon]